MRNKQKITIDPYRIQIHNDFMDSWSESDSWSGKNVHTTTM